MTVCAVAVAGGGGALPGVFQSGVPRFLSQDGDDSRARVANRTFRETALRPGLVAGNGLAAVWIEGLAGFMCQLG